MKAEHLLPTLIANGDLKTPPEWNNRRAAKAPNDAVAGRALILHFFFVNSTPQ
jgi:hypothetical protein